MSLTIITILFLYKKRGVTLGKYIWKQNAPFVLCLTHDVDRMRKQWYHYIYYAFHSGVKTQMATLLQKLREKDPFDNFYALVRLEKELGVRSTFFFLHETRRELSPNFMGRYRLTDKFIQPIFRMLKNDGFEIALHGSYDSYCNESLLLTEKNLLEELAGVRIVSTRQHHLNFDAKTTWKFQKEVGLLFDSTMGSAATVDAEFFGNPFFTPEGLLELPISIMDTLDFEDENIIKSVWSNLYKVASLGGVFMLDFHQCKFNSVEHPQIVNLYSEIINTAKNMGAWIAPMSEIGQWILLQEEC